MATCFGNGQLCTEGCQGEAKFSVRDLMEGAYRNGLPLHKLFVRELPELSHIMFNIDENGFANVKNVFNDLYQGNNFFTQKMMLNKCCGITWYEQDGEFYYGETLSTVEIPAGTAIPVASLENYANLGGVYVGDKITIDLCGVVCPPIVVEVQAVTATTITTVQALPVIPVGSRLVTTSALAKIGTCDPLTYTKARYDRPQIEKTSHFSRIPVGFDISLCEIAQDRFGYHQKDATFTEDDFINNAIKDEKEKFFRTFLNEVVRLGSNRPQVGNTPSSTMSWEDELYRANACVLAKYPTDALTPSNSLKGLVWNFDSCCAAAECDKDITDYFKNTVVANILASGVYKVGDVVTFYTTRAGLEAVSMLSEGFTETFRDNTALNVQSIVAATGLIRKVSAPYFTKFSYQGVEFDFVHTSWMDKVYTPTKNVMRSLPSSLMAMLPFPVRGMDYTDAGMPNILYNDEIKVEIVTDADFNNQLNGHRDCTSMKGHLTFAQVLMHTCSGAYQLVHNLRSIATCSTAICDARVGCAVTPKLRCDHLGNQVTV